MVVSRLLTVSSRIPPIPWSAASRYRSSPLRTPWRKNDRDFFHESEPTERFPTRQGEGHGVGRACVQARSGKAAERRRQFRKAGPGGDGCAPKRARASWSAAVLLSSAALVSASTLQHFNDLMSFTKAACFVCLVLLAGCAVGPDYKRPEATTIPAAYAGATNVVATDTGATNGWKVAEPQAQMSKGNWWEIFGDTELNGLESQASAANQQLKVAVARLAEARAQMDVTRAGLFPNISLSGSYTRQRSSPNAPLSTTGTASGKGATFNDFLVPLSLGYEVDLWGRVRRSVESSRAQAQASGTKKSL